jgi:uncharacterized RDD family membrane protein YckC
MFSFFPKKPEEGKPVYAGFLVRTLAQCLDQFFMILLALPFTFFGMDFSKVPENVMVASNLHEQGKISNDEYFNIILTYINLNAIFTQFILAIILIAAVYIGFAIWKQATPGKLVMGIKIVDADNFAAPSKAQQVIRFLGYFLSIFTFGLGFLWVAFDSRKQGFHDKVADTVVIFSRSFDKDWQKKMIKRNLIFAMIMTILLIILITNR